MKTNGPQTPAGARNAGQFLRNFAFRLSMSGCQPLYVICRHRNAMLICSLARGAGHVEERRQLRRQVRRGGKRTLAHGKLQYESVRGARACEAGDCRRGSGQEGGRTEGDGRRGRPFPSPSECPKRPKEREKVEKRRRKRGPQNTERGVGETSEFMIKRRGERARR